MSILRLAGYPCGAACRSDPLAHHWKVRDMSKDTPESPAAPAAAAAPTAPAAPATPAGPELKRVTTEYVDAEDRLRLSGETGDGGVLVLWMTQRMVNRLIGALAQWLEKQSGDVLPVEIAQGVAMKTAMSSLPPSPPVKPKQNETVASYLVQTVDLNFSPARCVLKFKTAATGPEQARLAFDAKHLRWWLGILRNLYGRAGWPTQSWPDWLAENKKPAGEERPLVVH